MRELPNADKKNAAYPAQQLPPLEPGSTRPTKIVYEALVAAGGKLGKLGREIRKIFRPIDKFTMGNLQSWSQGISAAETGNEHILRDLPRLLEEYPSYGRYERKHCNVYAPDLPDLESKMIVLDNIILFLRRQFLIHEDSQGIPKIHITIVPNASFCPREHANGPRLILNIENPGMATVAQHEITHVLAAAMFGQSFSMSAREGLAVLMQSLDPDGTPRLQNIRKMEGATEILERASHTRKLSLSHTRLLARSNFDLAKMHSGNIYEYSYALGTLLCEFIVQTYGPVNGKVALFRFYQVTCNPNLVNPTTNQYLTRNGQIQAGVHESYINRAALMSLKDLPNVRGQFLDITTLESLFTQYTNNRVGQMTQNLNRRIY